MMLEIRNANKFVRIRTVLCADDVNPARHLTEARLERARFMKRLWYAKNLKRPGGVERSRAKRKAWLCASTGASGPSPRSSRPRIDACEARVLERRAAAAMRWLPPEARFIPDSINCVRCAHICNFNSERQGGWCMQIRAMVSTWHPVECRLFKAAA